MGVDLRRIKKLGEGFEKQLQTDIQHYLDQSKVYVNEAGNWALHPEYFFFADGIASDLFIVDEE